MLLYNKGTRQAPRKYPLTKFAGTPSDSASPCVHCRSCLWCSSLFSNLRAAVADPGSFKTTYAISGAALRQAAFGGCKWCQTIADGIHGRVLLDKVYERWNHTDSDPSTPNSEAGTGIDDGEDSTDAEFEIEHDPKLDHVGNFDLDLDDGIDILAVDCEFLISLTFERDSNNCFSPVIVHIESRHIDGLQQEHPLVRLQGEESVELCYNINADAERIDDLNSSDSRLFPTEGPADALGSENCLEQLIDWFNSRQSVSTSFVGDSLHGPGRLIDIGTTALRVVKTAGLNRSDQNGMSYAALSYVWGASQPFVLLQSTEAILTDLFSIDALPRTIQDAVLVSRRLGLRYLWVDALCIIQDSVEDKMAELPKMGTIYKHAALTIVAAVAESAQDGFLHVKEQKLYHIEPFEIPYYAEETNENDRTLKLSYAADYKRWKDPINDRGWTFQEYLLSPFIASFTYRGIETIDRSTEVPLGRKDSPDDVRFQSLDWKQSIVGLSPEQGNIRQLWLAVRGEYSQRRLGYSSDKLVAIAAVAEQIGRSYKTKYVAGLWERDLAHDLKWCHADIVYSEDSSREQRPRRMPRPEGYIAPSWSWASINGPVDDYSFEGGGDVKDWLGFEVISHEVSHAIATFEYGAVTAAKLKVRGRVHSFFWRPEENPTVDCDGFLAVKTKEEPWPEWKVGEVVVDCIDPTLTDGCIVDCLAMSLVERIPGRDDIECLDLLPAGEDIYRRVGFGKVSVTALYEDTETFQVFII